MADDNKKRLYDELSKRYDLGSFEQFSENIKDETKRRKLYDATSKIYSFGSYEQFSGKLGFGANPDGQAASAAPEAPAAPAASAAPGTSAAQPAREENSAGTPGLAVPQASTWNERMEELGRSVMPGTPVSMPERKAKEPEANPFPYRGGLEKEMEGLAEERARATEGAAGDLALMEEYDRRLKEFHDSLDPTSKKTRENEQWLREHKAAYEAAKESDAMRAYDSAEEDYLETARAVGNAEEKIAERKNREEMASPAEVVATGKTVFGGDNAGRSDKEYMYRKLADELYKSSDKEYRFGSKYEDGYDGGPLERLWTASRQFVLDADNNVDSGSLTFGASKGLAEREAREVGDEYNRIITKTLKDMKMSDGDMAAVLSSIEMNGQKIRAMEDELDASSAEIDAMTSAYEDMVRARDPKAREYGESLQKKIDEHNRRVNEEFNPLLERYEGDRKAYETVMSAIDEAVENGLTGGQKALLDAMERFTEAKALSEPVRSTASKAGAGAEQSAEFMLDFILTGGIAKGGTRVAAKLAKNRALKKFGAEALKGMAVKPGLGLRLAADAAVSGIRTAAVFPRTIQAYGENATAYSGKDYAGRINFDRTQANALGNALLTQFIEYWSEGFGEYFGEAEQALFRSVTRQAPRQMIGKTLRSYSGSIGKYLDYGKFDGMFNEMLEEVVGSGLNAISGWLSGDRVGDADAMKEFFAGENMATLVLSFLPMSVIGAATNVGAYHDMRKRYDEAVEALNPFIESGAVSRAELERLSKDVPNLTPQEVKDRIVGIADRAREHNGGRLPGDFAKHVVGYLEGDFAMNLRADEWEDSREKMAVVDAYASAYSNPDPRMAWDAGQNVRETREAAVRAGFSEEELDDNDAYVLAQEARTMRDEDPARAEALLAYATAKAADAGIRRGYDERTRLSAEEYEENVRLNLDRGGTVLTATLPLNGQDATVFVTSTDATVNPDGSVSTPTGADGIVTYRESETGEEKTVKAGALSNARERNTDELVASVNGTYAEYRAKAFDQMANTVSLSGRSRAISEKVGQTVVVTDHGGVYEPFRVERMTNGGMNVVVGGERKALQGIARRMNLDIPAGTYLEAPVDKFYDLLAKEEDGSLSTIVPEGSKRMADVPRADLSGVAGTDQTIMVDGTPTTVHVDQVGPDGVWYNYVDAEGNQRSGAMSAAEFQEKMAGVPEQAPAAETEVSGRQAAPAQPAPQAQTPAPAQAPAQRQAFPVDESTGNKVYDHPSVTPEMAVNELFSGVEPGTKNAENRRRYVEGKAEKAAADVAEAENRIAGLRAQRALVDEWELPDGEEIDAFERRKDAEKRKFDDEIAEIEDGLTELRRKAAHWKEVRNLAERIGRTAPAESTEAADERKSSMRAAPREPGRRRSRTQRAVVSAVRGWEKRTGIKVTIYESPEEVEDQAAAAAIAKGEPPAGWYDPATGSVYVYLPAIDSVSELDRTFIHEAVSHKGLRGLLGDEDYAKLCDRVWNEVMTKKQREYYLAYNSHLSGTEEYLRRAAADEFIARLSENLDFADNRSIFRKIVDWVRELLGKDDPLTREEIVEDAKARATDYRRMTRRTLENLLADSLKLYEANTRRGREDAGLKREIGASVDGGAMQTGADEAGQTRFSVKSITGGGGLTVIEDNGRGMVAFETPDGRRFDAEHPVTAEDLRGIDDTVMAYMMQDARDVTGITPEQEARIWQAYADQLNAFLEKGVPKDGISGADRIKELWEWEVENTVYKSVSPNGDKQYSYSMDITRVCKKNEAVIKAISSMQRKVGYGITPGQIMDIYLQGVEEGYQTPCPVCYVFSHYINNGIVATVAIRGQEKYGADLVDPSTLSDEEKAERIQMWYDRMMEERKFNEDNADEIENARQECASIIEQIDILSQLLTSGRLKGEAAKKAIRRVRDLDNRFRSALALYTQGGLAGWIKQFAIREAKKGEKGFVPKGQPAGKKGEAPKAYVLWGDTWQGFPKEYALDLRLTAETIEKYPAIQRLRNARGSAGGKEIHFASNNDLGDIPMMLGTKDGVNFYMRAVLAGPGPERDALRKAARDRFESAHRYAQQQSLRGGQRMWSWSDNIERLAPDVFVNLMQLQMLGGALQAYSKQLEGVNLVASMGGYVNGSLMGYGKGWRELEDDEIETLPDGRMVLKKDVVDTVTEIVDGKSVERDRFLAKAGAPVFEVTVDGATKKVTLLFDDVVGIDAYGREGADGAHLKGLFDLNSELDKAGNILVGMNDPHVRAAMADPRVFFIIPWHASGNSVHIVQQMLSYLGVDTDVKDYTDYTDVQEEKDLMGKEVSEHVSRFWEEHRNETDFPCGIEGGIPSGEDGRLSKEQEHYRELRDAIFLGIKYDTGKKTKKGDKVYATISVRELADLVARIEAGEEEAPAWLEADGRNLMAWPAEIMNDAFLSQALRKIGERVDEQKMTSTDKGFIYPYEYWDESSTYDTADVNGARYLEYCRRLGVRPKFVGMLDGRPAEKDKGNFAEDTGYWKLLIDRRMYDVDGRFQDLDPVTTSEYDPKFVDPEWTEKNFHKTLVADDKGADRIADKVIEKEGIKFKEGGGIPLVDYGSDRKKDLRRYKALMAATKRIGIDDLVAMATPESVMSQAANEGAGNGGTMFRRSDEIAAEYPNWMDDQTSVDVEGSQRGQNTQVAGTVGTYRKVGDWIERHLGKGTKILDASSGLGLGTLALRERGFDVDDVEPYPGKGRREQPTYGGEDAYQRAIEDGRQYDYVISNAVLNVIPDDWRADVLANMARLLKPGGRMFINTRKAGEERTIRHKIELDSPREVLVGTPDRINSYQRFFTPAELKEYVERELGDGYTVEIATKANSGTSGLAAVVVTKKPSTDGGVDPNNPDVRFRRSGPEYEEETKRLFDRAKEHFGTTTDIREAGYVLPDGSMLDFSGRHWNSGGDNSWLNGMRQVDHRDISELEFERDGNTPSGFETNMPDFIQRGAIRLNGNAINLMMKPTREQEDALWKLIYRAEGTVDVDFGDGQSTEHYVSYDHAAPARIIQDIRRYFDEGVKPASNTMFRRSAPGFVSNAAAALGRIKMDKATPEQWLKMLEKEGGLKAGEDKWIGLSDWLKSLDRKTVTKQEIAEYIAENAIQIEEVEYDADQERTMGPIIKEYPGFFDAFSIDQNEATGRSWVDSIIDDRLAIELYNQNHDDKIDVESPLSDDDFQKIIKFAEDVYKKGGEIRDINPTRLYYTTQGLDTKREIALVVPTVEPYHGDSPEIHFDDEATEGRAIAWVRFGDTTVSDDSIDAIKRYDEFFDSMQHKYGQGWEHKMSAEEKKTAREINEAVVETSGKGKRVLVIDEIQSQRHQAAREAFEREMKEKYGDDWKDKATPEEKERGGYGDSKSEIAAAEAEMDEALNLEGETLLAVNEYLRPMKDRLDSGEITEEEFDAFQKSDPEAVRLEEAYEAARHARAEASRHRDQIMARNEGVELPTPAPFERNWHELAMKRMLRLAAEEGYDYVAWTMGDQQAERYNLAKTVDKISKDKEYVYIDLKDQSSITLSVDDDGKILDSSGAHISHGEYDGKYLSDLIGKELADKTLATKTDGWRSKVVAEGEGLKIGGDGMKGFYDDILPRFMNKYGKKWGVKVEDITLPNLEESGRVMHAVRVTPEMKESVMKGQTMFRRSPVTPEQDAEYMAAVEAGDMEKAGRMVRDAFKAAFPDTKVVGEDGNPVVVYHGGSFGRENEEVRSWGFDPFVWASEYHNGWFSTDRDYSRVYQFDGEPIGVMLNITRPFDMGDTQAFLVEDGKPTAVAEDYARRLGVTVDEILRLVQDEYSDDYDGERIIATRAFTINRNPEFARLLVEKGYDGATDVEYGGALAYMTTDAGQIKLADPVVYDDFGKPIPLSERFNPGSKDVRFRRMVPEEARLASAERESMDERIGTMPQIIGSWVHGATRDEMPAGHKTDKGYFDPDANDLAICMDNVSDLRDAVATAIHETIAYKGLQGILGERFRPAMTTLYASLDEEGRAWVNAYMGRNGLRPGDEAIANGILEYAADLAERGGDSVLGEVGEALGQVVSEVFDAAEFAFTPRELHYVLWAAAEHAKNPAWLESPSGRARNVLKKRELGINETDPNKPTDPDGGTRFRKPTLGTAKEDYEAAMNDWRTSMILENQDADLPVRIGMEKVMQEVGKQELSEEEDYAARHNLASSRADSERHDFMLFHFSPMIEKVREVQKRLAKRRSDREGAYQRIVDYLYAVSGLERNEWERANGGEDKDWSGITSLMGYEDKDRWEDAERDARDMIDKFREDLRDAVRRKGQTDAEAQAEADAMLDDLWDAIRSCTDFSLEHAYSHGLLSRDEFERLHGTASKPRLWDYYLPLRGFSEKTAEDEYSYATLAGQGSGDSVVMQAKGRWTEADNPLAYILHIAEREIVQGNENWARQALLRFTINAGKNTLLSERSPWYVKDGNTGKWVLAYPEPEIDPNTNEQTGTESIEDFEARMRALKAKGEARQGRKGLKLDQVMANKGHRNQHLIHIKVGGADRMIWVNGNPAMAKAVSGYGRTPKYAWFRSAGRKLSNLFTTYSLDFTVKNLIRDLNYSITALHMKEDRKYRHRYAKNWARNFGYGAFALPMIRLAAMWDSGALQRKPEWKRTKREQQFIDFMHDGGQTGYTVVRSVELLKEELRKTMAPTMLRQAVDAAKIDVAGVTIPILHLYSFGVRTLNEAFELLTRFTTYQTSRDMGRSGQRAAHDAKEISVNFNRRGAQSGDGTLWGNLAAFLGGTHYFYNAGVQGFDNFLRLYKARPWKMGIVSTGILTMGVLTPLINSMLAGIGGGGDDDDEKKKRRKREWYWNLPEWVRRNNLVLGFDNWYLALPLPVEFRALYGLGDITASAFIYHKMPNRKFGTVAADIISTAAEIVPFNPIEGIASSESAVESVVRSFTPDVLIPAVDFITNRDYTGRALMKENFFTKVVPKNQGAYASTPRLLVDVCQDIGATLGVDIAPGVIRDLMSNYGGGYYRFAEDISKQLFTDADRPRRWDDIPFLSGFTGHIDEDRGNTFYDGVLRDYERLSQKVVLKMNLYNRSDFIDEKMAYEYPETLPEKAKIQMILSGKDYELGKEYYFGMKDTGTGEFHKVEKVHKTGKQAGKPYGSKEEIKIPGVDTLRKRWKDARDVWVTMEKGTPEEADAKREVEEAWHKYCDAQADLAEKLLKIEYGE